MDGAPVRQRLHEVFGELGDAGASDHEGSPCCENDECSGSKAISQRCTVTDQTRLPRPLLEPTRHKAEANQGREFSFVLVVEQSNELVSVPRSPRRRVPAETRINGSIIRTLVNVLRARSLRSHQASLGRG